MNTDLRYLTATAFSWWAEMTRKFGNAIFLNQRHRHDYHGSPPQINARLRHVLLFAVAGLSLRDSNRPSLPVDELARRAIFTLFWRVPATLARRAAPTQARILVAAIITTASVTAMAASTPARFAAPGLWLVVSEVQGPMQQHSRITQKQCWNEQGESGQATVSPRAPAGMVVSHQIVNERNRSTVHLHGIVNTPHGPITQDITMVFTVTDRVKRRATMVGTGSLRFSSSPILDEAFRQNGHWLSGSCPAVLPPAKTESLQGPNMQALDALQKLARQLDEKARQDASN